MPAGVGHHQAGLRSPRVRAVRQLGKRALRERARAFLVEGPQGVAEALACDAGLTELYLTADGSSRHQELADQARQRGADVHLVSGEVMESLAQTVTPQGVLGVCPFIDVPLAELAGAGPRLVVVLAQVRDPGNAGTVLRTADAAGAQGVVFSRASVDPYNGKCVRATAGSLFHLPVVTGVSPAEAAASLRSAGLRSWRRTAAAAARSMSSPTRASCPAPPRGCSATRRGACPMTCAPSPTRRWRSRSTAVPRA